MNINPGGLTRCLQCDSLCSGVEERRHDGFARCPVCTIRMRIDFGRDSAPATNKQGKRLSGSSKTETERLVTRIACLL